MSYDKIKRMENRRLQHTKRVRNHLKKKVHVPSVYARRRRRRWKQQSQ